MEAVVSLILPAITLVGTIAIHFYIVRDLKERVKLLESKMELTIQTRNDDVLSFTKVLAAFNVTLGQINITLSNLDKTIFTVQETQKQHESDIRDLLINQGKK